MARYTLEEKAQAVAEYWLVGSFRRVARTLDMPDHKAISLWARQADAPQTGPHKRLRARAQALFESRATTLEQAFNRALELQMRDLPEAGFRDRTGFLKIAGEMMLLQKGRPTSMQECGTTELLDAEIADLLLQMNGARA